MYVLFPLREVLCMHCIATCSYCMGKCFWHLLVMVSWFTFVFTEICEDCLRLSANATTAVVGDVIMITSSMVQRPHNGISLLVNGLIAANPDFTCHTASNVLGHQVVYYCTAMKSAAVTIQSHVVFCDGDLTSQQINITFKEQRVMVDGTQNGDQNGIYIASSYVY